MNTPQQPIGSGFGPASTAEEVLRGLELSGRTAIVTGGCAGAGLETTRALTEAGLPGIGPARDPAKAKKALGGTSNVTIEEMDLAVPGTIDAFAGRVGGG